MSRIIRALVYAIGGGILCGVIVFGGGFALAKLLGPEAGSALGMLVPMVLTPLAMLAGAGYGGWRGYRA
jgi:hypothetical protein